MDRGPARAFRERDPGTRSILGARSRRRWRRPAPRRARKARPRSGRLRAAQHHGSLQQRELAAGPLSSPRVQHGRRRRADQQAAGHSGARRRLSAGDVCDGAAARSGRRPIGHRPRRSSPPQSHSGRPDALCRRSHQSRGRSRRLRQRRLRGVPEARAGRRGLCAISRPAGGGAQRGQVDRHRIRAWPQGHGPRTLRVRHGARGAVGPRCGVHRCACDGTGHRDGAGADLRRRARRRHREHRSDLRRHRVHCVGYRRLRKPPDDRRRVGRADGRQRRARQGAQSRGATPRYQRGTGRSSTAASACRAAGRRGLARPDRGRAARRRRVQVSRGCRGRPGGDAPFHDRGDGLRQLLPRQRSRSRCRHRPRAHPSLRRRAGQRQDRQPADRRRSGARRHRARHRQCAVRMDGLRRERPAHHHDVRRLPAADGDRAAEHRGHRARDAVAAQSDGHEGRRRGLGASP